MIILGNSIEDLQSSLNRLSEYCDKWGLEVNVEKTKIVVFRKRGQARENETWLYKNNEIEIVNDFNYLGVVFNYTGSFVLNNLFIYGKALKAMNVLVANSVRKYEINPKLCLQLFDAFVGSILNYGSKVWGYTKTKQFERVQLKFASMSYI